MTQPQLIGMIANRDFEYRNQLYFRDDRFQVSPVDAAILKRKQDARLLTPQDGPVFEPEPAPTPAPEAKHLESAPPKPKRPRKLRSSGSKRKTNRRDIPHAPVTK